MEDILAWGCKGRRIKGEKIGFVFQTFNLILAIDRNIFRIMASYPGIKTEAS